MENSKETLPVNIRKWTVEQREERIIKRLWKYIKTSRSESESDPDVILLLKTTTEKDLSKLNGDYRKWMTGSDSDYDGPEDLVFTFIYDNGTLALDINSEEVIEYKDLPMDLQIDCFWAKWELK